MKILTLEQILKEDTESYVAWGMEAIDNTKGGGYPGSAIKKAYGSVEKFLIELYNLTEKVNEISSKMALLIHLNDGGYKPRYSISVIDAYVKFLKLNPKQYGIEIKKITNNPITLKTFSSTDAVKDYLVESINQIKEVKRRRENKKNNKDEREADIFLYEDKKFRISLFTNYKTARDGFGGITDWCVTKQPFRWNEYTEHAILVLFKNKEIEFKSMKETPEAFLCNNYKVINDTELDRPVTYDMTDKDLFYPNITSDYHEIVEKKCIELFNGSLMNWKDVVKDAEEKDSNIFSDALKHVVGDKIIANEFVSISGVNNKKFYNGKNLETEYKDVLPLIKNAEYHKGLFISGIDMGELPFPKIKYVENGLVLDSFHGEVEVEDNNTNSVFICANYNTSIKTYLTFWSKIDVDEIEITDPDFCSISSSDSLKASNINIDSIVFKDFESNGATAITKEGSEITFETFDSGEELYFIIYMDINLLTIKKFNKVTIVIENDFDISEGLVFDKDVNEVEFIQNGDFSLSELKNMIADGTIEFENDNVQVAYKGDE